MSSHAIRGGRVASDHLLADLLVARELASEAIAAILRNPLLARDRLEDIVLVVQGLEHFVQTDLEKILKRRDATERGELDELRARLDELAQRLAAIEQRPGTASERAPIPIRKSSEGR